MIRKFASLLCGWLLAASCAHASAFSDANQQFESGDFAAAAASYEKILAAGGPDAAVLYNLGNSYQSLKQYGPAILSYERARLLAPRDPDLVANLALARKAATAFEEAPANPRLDAALDYLSRNEWSWLVAACAVFLGVLSVAAGAVKFPRRGRKLATISAAVAVLAIAAASTSLYLRRGEATRGIILSDNATVRLSPFAKADSLGTAGVGRVVHLGTQSGDFRYVEVPETHLRGWLAKDEVAPVETGS
jgi:tetratricopeptide (TPR) repeat protein